MDARDLRDLLILLTLAKACTQIVGALWHNVCTAWTYRRKVKASVDMLQGQVTALQAALRRVEHNKRRETRHLNRLISDANQRNLQWEQRLKTARDSGYQAGREAELSNQRLQNATEILRQTATQTQRANTYASMLEDAAAKTREHRNHEAHRKTIVLEPKDLAGMIWCERCGNPVPGSRQWCPVCLKWVG